ncbi:hypothetical protein [Pseudenterobacter timonensis]|uniref:hypothetical protein n=1 Tax=Pseudenterobacter timonensis TaxID=1755099 RepID=UPI000A47360B|nr:hypothetical protein [Pseudenterobacter timonensis]
MRRSRFQYGVVRAALDYLKGSLTESELLLRQPAFEPKTDRLRRYCQKLAQLTSGLLTAANESATGNVLYEMGDSTRTRLKRRDG